MLHINNIVEWICGQIGFKRNDLKKDYSKSHISVQAVTGKKQKLWKMCLLAHGGLLLENGLRPLTYYNRSYSVSTL